MKKDKKKMTSGKTLGHPTLLAVFNSIGDGVFTLDKDCRITAINPAGQKILGLKEKDVLGVFCGDIFKSDICGDDCPIRHAFFTGVTVNNYPVVMHLSSGKVLYLSVTATSIKNDKGEIIGGVETFRDISRYLKLQEELEERYHFENIIGKNKSMQDIFRIIENVSSTDVAVLIQGETGTGKELVARAIHYNGARRKEPFVSVNCSALSENLLESELFGHVKGSFTGAVSDRIGRFEMADKGTLFLDEIGDLNLTLQSKLLRVLETKEFEKVGSSKSITTTARIIAATNKDLARELEANKFRNDLFYRLNTVVIHIPPLRERKNDIPYLVRYFLNKFKKKYKAEDKEISPESLAIIYDYAWPGNVRQLEHCVEYSIIHCREKIIKPAHLPKEMSRDAGNLIKTSTEPELKEKDRIIEALKKTGLNKKRAAKILNMGRTTLYQKIKKYNIQ